METDLISNNEERQVKRVRDVCEDAPESIIQELLLEANRAVIHEEDA